MTGVNDLGVESQPSEIVSASPVSDTEQPRILKMIPASGSRISGNISLGVQAEDNVAVREIQIYASEDGETGHSYLLRRRILPVRIMILQKQPQENSG